MKCLYKILIVWSFFIAVSVWVTYYLEERDSVKVQYVEVSSPSFVERMSYYKDKIYQPRAPDSGMVECSLLMATYKRVKMLPQVLRHYCSKKSPVNKIVLVWNDPESPIPPCVFELGKACDKELKICVTKENKMTNRFLPQNLETECK